MKIEYLFFLRLPAVERCGAGGGQAGVSESATGALQSIRRLFPRGALLLWVGLLDAHSCQSLEACVLSQRGQGKRHLPSVGAETLLTSIVRKQCSRPGRTEASFPLSRPFQNVEGRKRPFALSLSHSSLAFSHLKTLTADFMHSSGHAGIEWGSRKE